MKITLTLLFTASIALAGDAEQPDFNRDLPKLHFKVSEAEKALATDLKNLGAEKDIADCPDEAQLAKIHQDEKRLDQAVAEWEKANH